MTNHTPIVLAILDGWGLGKPGPYNAISLAHTPHMTGWMKSHPNSYLTAYGSAVGLSGNTTGNSEVGHLNLGAGYVVPQDEVRITAEIHNGLFYSNKVLNQACETTISRQSALHILTLVGPGQVHSNIDHLWAMLELAQKERVPHVFVHVITDGRDASPTWMGKNAEAVQRKIERFGAKVVSVCGRYWAMDRDQRWDRTEQAYQLLCERKGDRAADLDTAIKHSYADNQTDEFIAPAVIGNGRAIKQEDVVVFLNFRADRARQLTQAFVDSAFTHFSRKSELVPHAFYTLTQYQEGLRVAGVAYPPHFIANPLTKVLSDAGLKQLHAAESEKYAHVTYFFNGGREEPYAGEERLVIASPKVATYDLKPEMSAPELTASVKEKLASRQYDVVIMNYANADMVAHTGNLAATIKAIEAVDTCLGELYATISKLGGTLIITADHGNAEVLKDSQGNVDTQHNSGVVPLIVVGEDLPGDLQPGVLADVSPTLLQLLGITPPAKMTAESLWVNKS